MKDHMKKTAGKRDFLLLAGVLLTACILILIRRFGERGPAAVVEIASDGVVTETFDLNSNLEYVIEGPNGGTNRLIIKDGEAWISEASCPDKICVHQGKISREGEIIVCLPNRMTARIVGEP